LASGAGALLCFMLGWSASRAPRATAMAIAAWIGGILFVLLSVESCQCVDYFAPRPDPVIKQVVLSILWAAIGLAAVFFGFIRKIAPLRYAALTLLGVTLIKILIIDMAQVEAIWRILSFLAVGLLLLAVSYVYHKQFAEALAK
ncbi:MAG TPA: DUF2339 domain-containing protein, partial [Tepidisphaeraceae bacterium]|nr:DUF2339 domain-containing protein [Tepidisphaeraceae bacterium]